MSKDTFPLKVLGGVATVLVLVFAAGLYALMDRSSGTERSQAAEEKVERQAEVSSPPSTLILPRLPEPAHARVPDTGSPAASGGVVRPLTASAVGRQGPPPAVRRPAAESRSRPATAPAPAAAPTPLASPSSPPAPAPSVTPPSEPAAPPTGPARVHPRPVVEPTLPPAPAPPVLLGRPAVPDSAAPAPPDTSGVVR